MADTQIKPGQIRQTAASAGDVLTWDGSKWAPAAPSAAGGQYRQFVYEASGGDFTFIKDSDGQPVMALEELE